MPKKKKKKKKNKKKKKGNKKKKRRQSMKYLVKYWINVDMLAEEIVDSEHINIDTNDLGKFKAPSKNAKYKLLDTIKVERTSYEQYDTKSNISNKDRTRNK